jgi:hypothetical protein
LRLEYDEPLANFAVNFNLRRYTEADGSGKKRKKGMWAGAYIRALFSST